MQTSPCFFGVTKQERVYQVSFEITNLCNLKCNHCCNDSSPSANKGLSKDEIFDLVDDLKKINTTSIYLTGGEPTIFPDFEEVIEYINAKDIDLVLASNGYSIIGKLDAIKKNISHRAGVFVSLDGSDEVHDEFRGVKGAFKNTVNSIKMLVEKGVSTRVSSVVWQKNISQLEEIIKLVKLLGVYQLHFSMLFNSGRAAKNNIVVEDDRYKEVIEILHYLINKYSTDEFVISTRRDRCLDCTSYRCYGGSKILHINSRGEIFPCSWAEKCELRKTFGAQWKKGNINECVEKVGKFDDLVKKRISVLGYSSCPAMAINQYHDELADDPINELLK